MSLYDFFDGAPVTAGPEPYWAIGFPRNPFRPAEDADVTPFYPGHVLRQVADIQQWAQEVHEGRTRQPLSLVGNVGAGKSRIIQGLRAGIVRWPSTQKTAVHSVLLSDSGYAKASIGAMLISGLELHMGGLAPQCPKEVLPIIWAILEAGTFPMDTQGRLAEALKQGRSLSGSDRVKRAVWISRWLQRIPLTPVQARDVGLPRAIDWEGELVRVVADVLRIAAQSEVLKTFFVFIDQLEELFRNAFSELRRSRLLTDLRGLVDEIDQGAPIGLLLAWDPASDQTFKRKYEALAGRLARRRVDLPLLTTEHAAPFANKWIDGLSEMKHFVRDQQPKLSTVVPRAWTQLRQRKLLLPGDRATPRDLLLALANEIDALAGVPLPSDV